MTNKTNTKPTRKRGARNTKLLFTAASIVITLGGTLGFLKDELAASANAAVAGATSNITVVYAAPVAAVTAVPADTAANASDVPTDVPAPIATDTPVPTAEPTLEPTATAQSVVVVKQQPVIVARTRSSK